MIHTPADNYPEVGDAYLAPTQFLDCGDPALREQAATVTKRAETDIEKAIRLFYWVRDGWRYDPFCVKFTPEYHIASRMMTVDRGYCLSKAILLATAARVVGIPSAIGLSDVTNHLSSEKLRAFMGGSSLFINHGFALLHIDGKWVKAAPAFNREMCDRFGVRPVEFDGRSDAVLQEFDLHNRRHMEYVANHGYWSDFPYHEWYDAMARAYPLENWVDDDAPEFSPT